MAKATLLWVTVGFLAAASTLYDAQQTRQSTVGHRPALEPAHAAVVRVSGHVERSGSGGYWVRLSDFAGKVGGRAEGVLGDNPSEHRFDLAGAPTDRSDTLEVWAGKSEGWEGYLNLVVTIDGRFVGCADTSAGDPAVAEAYASHRLGTRPQPGSEECRLYLWYA